MAEKRSTEAKKTLQNKIMNERREKLRRIGTTDHHTLMRQRLVDMRDAGREFLHLVDQFAVSYILANDPKMQPADVKKKKEFWELLDYREAFVRRIEGIMTALEKIHGINAEQKNKSA